MLQLAIRELNKVAKKGVQEPGQVLGGGVIVCEGFVTGFVGCKLLACC